MKKFILTLSSIALLNPIFAQKQFHRCGTATKSAQLLLEHPELKIQREIVENTIQDYIKNNPLSKKDRATIYKIPVVVHVVHNGEAIGTGANISVAQITSQITALNKDFRKLNTDVGNVPSVFTSLVADCEVEFCLATTSPTGTTTNGIDRINGGSASWDDVTFDNQIKPSSSWDYKKYLNIWLCNFDVSVGLLGYTANAFQGFPGNEDGVVIDYHFFGTTGSATAPYNKGRTATHEIGHYFNLDHVWGDDNGSCSGSDNVSDTPNQSSENYGCPTFPNISCTNGPNGDLFMNYMDYVDDNCMMMFTTGQKTRLRAAITTYRAGLLTSNACFPLAVSNLNNDDKSINIFPNPTNNHFYINSNNGNLDESFTISIINTLGQELTNLTSITKESQSRYYINASALTNGTYFIKMTSKTQQFSKTISIIK